MPSDILNSFGSPGLLEIVLLIGGMLVLRGLSRLLGPGGPE